MSHRISKEYPRVWRQQIVHPDRIGALLLECLAPGDMTSPSSATRSQKSLENPNATAQRRLLGVPSHYSTGVLPTASRRRLCKTGAALEDGLTHATANAEMHTNFPGCPGFPSLTSQKACRKPAVAVTRVITRDEPQSNWWGHKLASFQKPRRGSQRRSGI